MSKPKKTKKVAALRPDGLPAKPLYERLPMDNGCQNDCLVLDKHGTWFRFPSSSHCTIVEAGIEKKIPGFAKFDDLVTLDEAVTAHSKLFGEEPAKSLDPIMVKLAVWKGLCHNENGAKNRMEKPVAVDHTTGEPKRVKKLANRKYVLVKNDWAAIHIPQALACLRIIRDSVTPGGDGVVGEVTEELLKAKIMERQAELHTRQDPWRIFQYYRPRLIEAQILRLI